MGYKFTYSYFDKLTIQFVGNTEYSFMKSKISWEFQLETEITFVILPFKDKNWNNEDKGWNEGDGGEKNCQRITVRR